MTLREEFRRQCADPWGIVAIKLLCIVMVVFLVAYPVWEMTK